MAKDKNSKKKNSFIKKFASFALAGAMLAGIGTGNLMASNGSLSASIASTNSDNNTGLLKAQAENLGVVSVDFEKANDSDITIGVDLGTYSTHISYWDGKSVNSLADFVGSNIKVEKVNPERDKMIGRVTNNKTQNDYDKFAERIFNLSQGKELLKNAKGSVKIALTYSDPALLTSSESVRGDVCDLLRALESVYKSKAREVRGNDALDVKCMAIPQAMASVVSYAHQQLESGISGKVVTVDCGHSGVSICGGKMNGKKLSTYQETFYSGCGGKDINEAIIRFCKEKNKDFFKAFYESKESLEEKLKSAEDLGEDPKYVKSLKRKLASAKDLEKSINAGANAAKQQLTVYEDVEVIPEDMLGEEYEGCSIDGYISREEFNDILKSSGILDRFKSAFEQYVQSIGGIGAGDTICFTGGSSRVMLFEEALKELSPGGEIKEPYRIGISASGAALYGAFL